jgi:hypothetical protein
MRVQFWAEARIFLSVMVFWIVTLCGLVGGYTRAHRHTSYKTIWYHNPEDHNDIFTAVKTSDLEDFLVHHSIQTCCGRTQDRDPGDTRNPSRVNQSEQLVSFLE